jgi:hypothetical protein
MSSIANGEKIRLSSNHLPVTLGFDAVSKSDNPAGHVRVVMVLMNACDHACTVDQVGPSTLCGIQ